LWITLSIVGALALCAVAIPVRLLVLPLVIGTVTADHGEPSPTAALFAFVLTFEEPQRSVGVDRLIVAQRRAELGQQRRDYLQAMEADRKATGWSGRLEHASQPTDTTSIEGDRATVVDSYGMRWTPPPQLHATPAVGALWYHGQPLAWRAEARRDRTGWRLWSVTIPALVRRLLPLRRRSPISCAISGTHTIVTMAHRRPVLVTTRARWCPRISGESAAIGLWLDLLKRAERREMVDPTNPLEQLRTAFAGRPNWHIEDSAIAVYRPPGATGQVRVRPIERPDERRRYNFHGALLRHGQITNTAQCFSADEAVRWAESTKL